MTVTQPLEGVGFEVYRLDSGTVVDTIYTDEAGVAYSIELPYGQYELFEFSGLSSGGYYSANITQQDEVVEVYVTNYYPRGNVRVYKTGNDGRIISGAVFSVYQVGDDEVIEDITTNSSGYAYSSSLLAGEYYLIEKSVPNAYVPSTEKHYFTIEYDGQTVSLTLVNDRCGESGRVKIIKTDDSGNPLSGVVFGLYRKWDNKKLAELTTGSDGTVVSSELIPDDYYLVELTGKTGYEMASGQIPFSISGTGITVDIPVVNPKIRIFGKVQVIKNDDASNPIPGVRFGVYRKLTRGVGDVEYNGLRRLAPIDCISRIEVLAQICIRISKRHDQRALLCDTCPWDLYRIGIIL